MEGWSNSAKTGHSFHVWARIHPESPYQLLLVDTGASVSTIPVSLFNSIPERSRPRLKSTDVKLVAGNKTGIRTYGTSEFEVEIQDLLLDTSFYVCSDDVQAILGMDFMHRHNVSVMVAQRQLFIGNQSVRIHDREGARLNQLVVAAKRLKLGPGERMVVPGRVVGRGRVNGRVMVVEPASTLYSATGVLAPGVTVVPRRHRVPIEIANLTETKKIIPAGTLLGTMTDAIAIQPYEETQQQQTRSISHIMVAEDTNVESSQLGATEVPQHLRGLYEDCKKRMTPAEDASFRKLLHQYQDIFARHGNDLGRSNLVTHHIETGQEPPVRQRPRRLPQVQYDEISKQVKALADAKIITPSTSTWGSNVLLVKKKDGSWRMCVDYRELNQKTKNLSPYMLPRIDDTLDSLGHAKLFCTLDLIQGYHQVELSESSKEKTAFLAPRMSPSHYQYNYMPFGIAGGPATFQRLMDQLLQGLEYKIALAYLDDIIVYGVDVPQCLERLRIVFDRIRAAGLKLKPKKCEMFKKELLYLGHIVSGDGIKCDPAKIAAVKNWQPPRTVRQVRVFLGTINYYNRFVKDFSAIAKPLYQLTKKGQKFIWTKACAVAYEILKHRLITAPIMAYPRPEGLYILDTDASGHAIGGVLSQMQVNDAGEEEEKVIAYGSRTLNTAETRYCTRRREMLAIVHFVKTFRSYLYGRKVLIRTDHASLQYIKKMKDPADQFARWIERLEETQYKIEVRQGKHHANADGLSRLVCGGKKCICEGVAEVEEKEGFIADTTESSPQEEAINVNLENDAEPEEGEDVSVATLTALDPTFRVPPTLEYVNAFAFTRLWTIPEMVKAQSEDPDISLLAKAKRENLARPTWNEIGGESEALKSYWLEWRRLEIHNGLLYRRWESNDGFHTQLQLIMPYKYQEMMCEHFHDSTSAAHMGRRRALKQVQKRAFWYQMAEDLKLWIRTCEICQRRRRPGKTPRAPMAVFTAGVPNEQVSMDLCGPLSLTARGNKFILVITDKYTKFVRAFAVPCKETEPIVKLFMDEWVCIFGCPRQVHSDRGKEFDSVLMKQMCAWMRSEKTRTTAFHPSSDGQVERYNQTMMHLIHALARDNPKDWDLSLPYTSRAYNATRHESTGFEPNMLMFNRQTYMPYDVMTPTTPDDVASPHRQYVKDVRRRMRRAHQLARNNLGRAATATRKYNERRYHLVRYKTGDPVMMKIMEKVPGVGKMIDRYAGPYYVVDVLSDSTLRVVKAPNKRPVVVHHDRLTPYKPRTAEENDTSWVKKLARARRGVVRCDAETQMEHGQVTEQPTEPAEDVEATTREELDETTPIWGERKKAVVTQLEEPEAEILPRRRGRPRKVKVTDDQPVRVIDRIRQSIGRTLVGDARRSVGA